MRDLCVIGCSTKTLYLMAYIMNPALLFAKVKVKKGVICKAKVLHLLTIFSLFAAKVIVFL